MLSVQQLILLNRELRESLVSGLAAHISGLNEGKFLPLIHLAVQVLRRHEALELLAERGLGQEAGMMLRSMFEATVNALGISKDLNARMKRYHLYQFFSAKQYSDLADKKGITGKKSTTKQDKHSKKL